MSNYILRGNLRGALSSNCSEALPGVRVRFYRLPHDAKAGDRQGALTADQIHAKHDRLLGESLTDAAGDFSVILEGGASGPDGLEFDAYFDTVPHRRSAKPAHAPAAQFAVTTVQPKWQATDGDFVAASDYCLPEQVWSAIRERFDAWVIYGQVKPTVSGQSVEGLRVWAFDRDWLEDDVLGPATTDAEGTFRIDYCSADFRKAPMKELELGGPDVYFRVETQDRTVLLEETPRSGRAVGRENIGPCFCIELKIGASAVEETEPVVGPM